MPVMRLAVLALVLACGCDALANSDYVGEPMFALTGTFASAPADPVGGIALEWQDPAGPGGPGIASTIVPVSVAFPATFHVAVPGPPPQIARFSFGDSDVELAEAYVYVVADASSPQVVPRGSDRTHALVYASGDVAAGTLAADYLGGAVGKGYHLRAYSPAATTAPGQGAMVERCVATGGTRAACTTRRAYRLDEVSDGDPLRIAVMAP
jgi:hypothetical protein